MGRSSLLNIAIKCMCVRSVFVLCCADAAFFSHNKNNTFDSTLCYNTWDSAQTNISFSSCMCFSIVYKQVYLHYVHAFVCVCMCMRLCL